MASVYKRGTDKARGKQGKWTCAYTDETGRRRTVAGVADRAESLRIATELEEQARLVREGLVDPQERALRRAAVAPVGPEVDAFRADLVARGNTPQHCTKGTEAVRRLLALGGIRTVGEITAPAIQAALGRLRAKGRSARTCNHALTMTRAFVAWLDHSGRIAAVPRGLAGLPTFNQEADRRLDRRALSAAEMDRLLAAAAAAPPVVTSRRGYQYAERVLSGPERAILYRLAMGTGFRANELRTLTPECFRLDGPEPAIVLRAEHAKNRKGTAQPITVELATVLRPFVAGRPPGEPVIEVPEKTAKLLRRDLARAGIPFRTAEGVVDFHALRASYISELIRRGVNPKIVQTLARHSTITLTLDRYAKVATPEVRQALERKL